MAMKKMRVKANDQIQRKKAKPANAAMKKIIKKKPAAMKKVVKKKPAAMKKVTPKKAPIKKKKAHDKKEKAPRYYPAKFVEDLKCEFYIQKVKEATETLVKVYYSKDRKGLEYRYYRSFRPE